jgi:hypothetical protein
MTTELNRVLAPRKRIPLLEFRMHVWEIRDLHEGAFPHSRLRSICYLLLAMSAALFVAAIIIGIR